MTTRGPVDVCSGRSRLERTRAETDTDTVDSIRSSDAPDGEIATYAATHGWVVFTNDDDFYADDVSHGPLVSSQIEVPRPGDVVDASAITRAFPSNDGIDEVVPDRWS